MNIFKTGTLPILPLILNLHDIQNVQKPKCVTLLATTRIGQYFLWPSSQSVFANVLFLIAQNDASIKIGCYRGSQRPLFILQGS